jgi:NADH:ubiquinone oxidoreductase subunit 3 (subunit A)
MTEFLTNPYFLGIAALCSIIALTIQVYDKAKKYSEGESEKYEKLWAFPVGFVLVSVCLILFNLNQEGFDFEFAIGYFFNIMIPIGLPASFMGWVGHEGEKFERFGNYTFLIMIWFIILLFIGPNWNVKQPATENNFEDNLVLMFIIVSFYTTFTLFISGQMKSEDSKKKKM